MSATIYVVKRDALLGQYLRRSDYDGSWQWTGLHLSEAHRILNDKSLAKCLAYTLGGRVMRLKRRSK